MDKNDFPEKAVTEEPKAKKSPRIISGFWRRLFAFVLDGIILGIFGLIIGTACFDFFAELGGWARLFGFTIALLYFGILNSTMGKGQTIGKRLLKIQVVDKEAKNISPLRSFARFMILGPPYFINGALVPPNVMLNSALSLFLGLVVFFVGGAIIYLYVFNHKTRQSLHDLVAGTYVIRSPLGQEHSLLPMWKGHLCVVGLMFVTVLVLITVIVPKLGKKEFFAELLAVQQSIQDSGLVHVATVSAGKSFGKNIRSDQKEKWETTYFSTNAVLKKEPSNYEEVINEIASVIMEHYPPIMGKDTLVIDVTYGYDIGISHAWKKQRQQHSPEEWKQILSDAKRKHMFRHSITFKD